MYKLCEMLWPCIFLVPQPHLYLGFNSVIAAPITVPCLVIRLTYVSLQVHTSQESGHLYFAAVPDPKGPSALTSSW